MGISRRTLIAAPSVAAAAIAQSGMFSASDTEWLGAIVEQIVPTDEFPGAREAGVVTYIQRQLAGPLKRFRGAYSKGLDEMKKATPGFLTLSFDQQTAYLKTIESTPFFQMVADHTMQGYYGDPMHGGNRDRVSWRMLKVDKFMDHGPWKGHRHEAE